MAIVRFSKNFGFSIGKVALVIVGAFFVLAALVMPKLGVTKKGMSLLEGAGVAHADIPSCGGSSCDSGGSGSECGGCGSGGCGGCGCGGDCGCGCGGCSGGGCGGESGSGAGAGEGSGEGGAGD